MTEVVDKGLRKIGITVSKPILAILCITFGILALAWEPLLRYVVGVFFIIGGVLLLTDLIEIRSREHPPPPPP